MDTPERENSEIPVVEANVGEWFPVFQHYDDIPFKQAERYSMFKSIPLVVKGLGGFLVDLDYKGVEDELNTKGHTAVITKTGDILIPDSEVHKWPQSAQVSLFTISASKDQKEEEFPYRLQIRRKVPGTEDEYDSTYTNVFINNEDNDETVTDFEWTNDITHQVVSSLTVIDSAEVLDNIEMRIVPLEGQEPS